jgi:hypothetical protein
MKAVLLKALCASGEFFLPESTVDLSEAEFIRLEAMGVLRAAKAVDIFLAAEPPEPEKPKRGRKAAVVEAPEPEIVTPGNEPEDL